MQTHIQNTIHYGKDFKFSPPLNALDYETLEFCEPHFLTPHPVRLLSGSRFNNPIFIDFDFQYEKVISQFEVILNKLFGEILFSLEDKKQITKPTQREMELNWIASNQSILTEYKGNWICIENDKLITFNKKLINVLNEAKEKGIIKPFVYYVPDDINKPFIGNKY